MGRVTATLATTPGLGTTNSFRAETHSLASRSTSTQQHTWAAAGILASWGRLLLERILSPVILTPDKTGLPSGGDTFEEFRQIMRTGVDFDHLHPTCPGVPDATCVPAPFNGNLLQVMPWPNFQNMTDNDLRAIYEYLRAIPCIEGPPAPDPLHHDCH